MIKSVGSSDWRIALIENGFGHVEGRIPEIVFGLHSRSNARNFDRVWDIFLSVIPLRQQCGVAAGGGGVDGDGLLGREAREIMRAAGLGTGA